MPSVQRRLLMPPLPSAILNQTHFAVAAQNVDYAMLLFPRLLLDIVFLPYCRRCRRCLIFCYVASRALRGAIAAADIDYADADTPLPLSVIAAAGAC